MRYVRYLAAAITVFLMFSFAIPAAYAGTQDITTTADNTLSDGFCSLREAISRANLGSASTDCPNITSSPNTLRLASGATYTLGSVLPNITTNTLTIEPISGTATIEAAATPNTATYRVLAFNSTGTLTLNNLTIRHGDTTTPGSGGGCVRLFTNGTLVTNNVAFTACRTAGDGGGAIAATLGGTIQITGGSFTGNSSVNPTSGGGAININGGTNAASLTISGGTSFTTNSTSSTSSSQVGGAIICVLCSAMISGATFTSNSAATTVSLATGGALYFNTDLSVSITGSTFTTNSLTGATTSDGGAIGVSNQRGINLTISGSVFTGNTTSGGTARGGAIFLGAGVMTLSDSQFVSNTAGTDGDAIYHSSSANSTLQTSCITNNGDTAVFDAAANGSLDASGGGDIALSNWWGTNWGPRISAAGGGSAVSNGDSINGNGNLVSGSILVDVNLSNAGTSTSAPIGDWLTTAPTVAGAPCQTCSSVSGGGEPRGCY